MAWPRTRSIPVLVAAATLLPVGALIWLGLRVLEQDREAEGQQRRERLQVAAARVALEIDRRLQDVESELSNGRGIRLTTSGLESTSGAPILYQPVEPPSPIAGGPSPLTSAEVEEFQRKNLAAAAAEYRRLAAGANPATRAAALVGLARVHRLQGDRGGAFLSGKNAAEVWALENVLPKQTSTK